MPTQPPERLTDWQLFNRIGGYVIVLNLRHRFTDDEARTITEILNTAESRWRELEIPK